MLNLESNMVLNKKILITIASVLFALVCLSYLSALNTIFINVSILNLLMGELALAFVLNSLIFPSANNKRVIELSTKYLIITAGFFTLVAFLPSSSEQEVFSYSNYKAGIPLSVSVNSYALLLTNIFACLFLFLNHKLKAVKEEKVFYSYKKADIGAEIWGEEKDPEKLEKAVKSKEMASELKSEVNEIFDIYLERFHEEEEHNVDKKLEKLENALVKAINPQISAALCLNENFEKSEDTVFHWEGIEKEDLSALFQDFDKISTESGTGKLCQCLINLDETWYMIAQYRGMYLVLKSRENEFSNLLDVSYKVFKTLG